MEAVLERPRTTSKDKVNAFKPEPSIRDRTIKAAKLYLKNRGIEVRQKWESDSQLGFIAEDEGTLVFVHVVSNGLDKKGFPTKTAMTREKLEHAAIEWLSKHGNGYENVPVRFDEIALKVLCKDKALIRHHTNAWGTC